jgi:hypothetical protein
VTRRRRTGHDRNALLWTGACFVAMQLGLALAIEWRLPILRDPEYAVKAERLRARVTGKAEPPFTVVMLGSSRTYHALDAGRVEAPLAAALGRPVVVFNFGITGAGPTSHLVNLNRLLAEGVHPDLLLIEVLPSHLDAIGQVIEVGRLPADRLWYRDLAVVAPYAGLFPHHRAEWWCAFAVPWYAHRFVILSRTQPLWLPNALKDGLRPVDDSGWTGGSTLIRPTAQRVREGVELAYQEYASVLRAFHLATGPDQPLEALLRVCRREGIAAGLVLLPEGTAFRSWYPAPVWTQIEAYLDELSRRYAVPLIDTRTWLPDTAFYDSHHMLLPGAEAFTERFGREVVEPLARSVLQSRGHPSDLRNEPHAAAEEAVRAVAPGTE